MTMSTNSPIERRNTEQREKKDTTVEEASKVRELKRKKDCKREKGT